MFKYRSESGDLVDVRRRHINEYIKATMGEQFSAKDFRTWAGSLLAACALAREGGAPAANATERKRRIAAAIQRFEEGRVIPHTLENVAELAEGGRVRVERCERALLRLLRESGPGRGAARKRRAARARRSDEPDRSLDPPESGRVAASG